LRSYAHHRYILVISLRPGYVPLCWYLIQRLQQPEVQSGFSGMGVDQGLC